MLALRGVEHWLQMMHQKISITAARGPVGAKLTQKARQAKKLCEQPVRSVRGVASTAQIMSGEPLHVWLS